MVRAAKVPVAASQLVVVVALAVAAVDALAVHVVAE